MGEGQGTPVAGTAVSVQTLATMIDEVLAVLWDVDQRVWTDAQITKAIRFALYEYSHRYPCETISTLTLAADGREIDLGDLDQPLSVSEVWYPYTAADPEFPPEKVAFRLLWNEGTPTLWLECEASPQSGDTLRVFWTHHHTLNGLDGATVNTFFGYLDGTLARLAAGYAAFSFASTLFGTGTVNSDIANKLYLWGLLMINEWRMNAGLPELKSSGLSFSLNSQSARGLSCGEFAFMENVTLEYLAVNKIRVPYDVARVPRVTIDGFILEATADVDLAASISGAAGARYIFAVRTPGNSDFTIAESLSRVPAAQQRLIGSCYFDGADITEIYDMAFSVSADIRDALEGADAPSVDNVFITDSAADTLIAAHALLEDVHGLSEAVKSLITGDLAGAAFWNIGVWVGVDTTLADIAACVGSPSVVDHVECFDPDSSLWRTVTYLGGAWIGDTTFVVERGSLVAFDLASAQYVTCAWWPYNNVAAVPVIASSFVASSAGYFAGVSGSFTTNDGKTVTVKCGIVTSIV